MSGTLPTRGKRLPILVERFEKGQSLIIACEHCGFEETLGPDDINCDGYSCKRCGKAADYKYYEGEQCKNCGKLDFYFSDHLAGCCSRPCMLQAEYAEELAAQKGGVIVSQKAPTPRHSREDAQAAAKSVARDANETQGGQESA